ncbi:MAG: exosortase E/protease, VPEID-CTERM system [Planctomycetia bacterium]
MADATPSPIMPAMPADIQTKNSLGGEAVVPWRAFAIVAALVAIEASLAGWIYGRWLLATPGKRPVAIALVGLLVGLWAHVERHRDSYRSARVRWPLFVAQSLAFAGILAVVGGVSTGTPDIAGPGWQRVIMLGLPVAAWLVCSLAAIAPDRVRAQSLIGAAAFCAAVAVGAWSMGDLTQAFWTYTGDTTVTLVEFLLSPFAGGNVVRPEPFVVGTDAFRVRIAPSCSGFHGIGLMTVLLAGSLWWFRGLYRFPQALLLLPLGLVLVWLANVVRITALILVGIWISPEIAVDGFHSTAGWLAFLTVGLGILWTTSRMPYFARAVAADTDRPRALGPAAEALPSVVADRPRAANTPTTACLLPFLTLTGVTMLTRAFTSGFDLLYPVRVVCVAAVLWWLRGSYAWRQCRVSAAAVGIGVAAFAVWMALTPIGAIVAAVMFGMEPVAPDALQVAPSIDPGQLGRPWAFLWLLFRVLGSVVTVPIAEELFFRGFVIRRCLAEDADSVADGTFSWFSFVVSSLAFGLLHGDAWLAGIVAGMLFALALYRRGRLDDAVVAHATTNALLSGTVIATGAWSQWG